jgi:hypothetical protein
MFFGGVAWLRLGRRLGWMGAGGLGLGLGLGAISIAGRRFIISRRSLRR